MRASRPNRGVREAAEGSRSPPSQPSISPALRSAVSAECPQARRAKYRQGRSAQVKRPNRAFRLRCARRSRGVPSSPQSEGPTGPLGSGEGSQLTKPQRTDLPPEHPFPQIRPNETWVAILRVIFA